MPPKPVLPHVRSSHRDLAPECVWWGGEWYVAEGQCLWVAHGLFRETHGEGIPRSSWVGFLWSLKQDNRIQILLMSQPSRWGKRETSFLIYIPQWQGSWAPTHFPRDKSLAEKFFYGTELFLQLARGCDIRNLKLFLLSILMIHTCLFICLPFVPMMYCNFSAGNLDFYKGSLVCE